MKLLEIFSQFGLIYEVQVMDSSDNSEGILLRQFIPPIYNTESFVKLCLYQFSILQCLQEILIILASEEINSNCASSYAFVKFYSAREARRAKESTHGKWILGGQFLKVKRLFMCL